MKCKFCGAENTDDAKFCIQCGKEIPVPVEEAQKRKEANGGSNVIYCSQCGEKNFVSSDFCHACGANLWKDDGTPNSGEKENVKELIHEAAAIPQMLLNEKEQDRNDTVCPFCGASDCTVTQKTNATVTSKFGFGSGCCGMLLLGWPGLLCGLCGSNTKTDLASETWWACKSCGKLHISTPDAIKKWEEALLGMWGNVIFAGIFYAIVRWLFGSGFLSLIAFWVGVYMPFEEIREIHQNLKNEFGASIIQFLNPAQKKGALLSFIFLVLAAIASELLLSSIWEYWLND